MKFNFALMKVNFTKMEINFALMEIYQFYKEMSVAITTN